MDGLTHGLIRCMSTSPGSTLAHANFHSMEISDSPGINHFGLNALPRESDSSDSSNARIGKRGRLSATKSRRREHASRRMTGLNIATVLNRVSPQGSIRAVARSILELAFLEHDLDGAHKRVHRYLQVTRQARLMMCSLECLPERTGVADQAIAGVKRLRKIETREAPIGALRIRGLIVAIQARGDILGIPDAVERELLDHQTRDNLCFAGHLQGRLLREQFLLTHEEREELDLLTIERVMHVT